jgi:hypothetical protein
MKEKKKSRFSDAIGANAKRQKERSNFGYLNLPEGVTTFKVDPGKSMFFDILPYEVTDKNHPDKKDIEAAGGLWYRRPFMIHSIPNGEHTDKVVCPTSFGKPCPICEYVKQMKDNGATFDEIKPFKVKERNLYVVIPYGHKEMEEKPYIWDDTQWYFQKMLNDELSENTDYLCFPDLENGLMLKVRFSDDTYNSKPAPKPTRIDFKDREENGGQQYTEKILKKIPNLDEVLIVLSYKELEMKLSGIEDSVLDEPEENKDSTKSFDRKKKTVKNLPPTPVYTYEEIQGMDFDELVVVADNTDIDISECNDDEDEIKAFLIIKLKLKKPEKKSKTPKKPVTPTWDELQELEIEELIEIGEAWEIDMSDWDEDEIEDIKADIVTQLEIEKPEKKSSKRNKPEPEPEKKAKKKPEPDDDDKDDLPFPEKEVKIGTKVHCTSVGKGTYEITAINKKAMTATLEDEDGEEYEDIRFHKFSVVSFGGGKDEKKKLAKEDVKPTGKNKCPNGHVFGKDFEKFKDCSDCPKWDDCSDE